MRLPQLVFGLLTMATLLSFTPAVFADPSDSDSLVPMPRPTEYPVHFAIDDFNTKPWMRNFQYTIVVNRADAGSDRQSIRVYHEQQLVTYAEISSYLQDLTNQEQSQQSDDVNLSDRAARIIELGKKQWSPNVFKVSTGRNAFEPKGQHNSQHDSWSVTPTGFYVPQAFAVKHKSESYSSSMCDSIFGQILGDILRKQMCTYMENVTFFNGGIGLHKAIPGTEGALGSKASGGCVRLPAALAEYLFHNLQAVQGQPVPLVNQDGTVATTATGEMITTTVTKSIWGQIPASSALIIVQDQVQ